MLKYIKMYYKIKLHTHAFMFEAVNNSMSIIIRYNIKTI